MPPSTTMTRNSIERTKPKLSGTMRPYASANSAPASPAYIDDRQNAAAFAGRTSMPVDAAARAPGEDVARQPCRADQQDEPEVPQALELAERDAEQRQRRAVVGEREAGHRERLGGGAGEPAGDPGGVEQDVLAEE